MEEATIAVTTKFPASSPSPTGQRRGACGHLMADFDHHQRCCRCREAKRGQDLCVLEQPCPTCESLTPAQKAHLAVPIYKERKLKKEAKATKEGTGVAPPEAVGVLPHNQPVVAEARKDKGKKKKTGSVTGSVTGSPNRPDDQTPVGQGVSVSQARSPPTLEDPVSQQDLLTMVTTLNSNFQRQMNERFSRLEASLLSAGLFGKNSGNQQAGRADDQAGSQQAGSLPADQPVSEALPAGSFAPPAGNQASGLDELPVDHDSNQMSVESADDYDVGFVVDGSLPGFSGSTGPSLDPPQTLAANPESAGVVQPSRCSRQERSSGATPLDQEASSDLSFRDTMSSVRSLMGWTDVPEFESTSAADDQPWLQPSNGTSQGKISVNLPVDEHLCRKMEQLQVTLAEGYPTKTTEPAPLTKGQFVRAPPRQKWYGMYQKPEVVTKNPSRVKVWSQDPARLNSIFTNICRPSSSSSPSSLPVTQENLRRWERQFRDQTVVINHAAGLSRCLGVLQKRIDTQLQTLLTDIDQFDLPDQVADGIEELSSLSAFHKRISTAVSGTIRDLTDGVFASFTNTVLLRRDSFLDGVKSGITSDTLQKLRASPLHSDLLFADDLLVKAEQEIRNSEQRPNRPTQSDRGSNRHHPYSQQARKRDHGYQQQGKSEPWKRYGKKRPSASVSKAPPKQQRNSKASQESKQFK